MKFKTTPYHSHLLKDSDRLSVFFEAINEYDLNNDLAYDLGCGSGVLSYFLADKFKEVIALEIDEKASRCAQDNLSDFKNVKVINSDALKYEFRKKADLIVCEMLDTALIDEEEVPVLNQVKKHLKEGGEIIPRGIINTAELVSLERHYIHWDEDVNYEVLSNPIIYSEINFKDDINPDFKADLNLKVNKDGIVNGLKITTYTKLNENIICGPTPMLNPPLLIPLDERKVRANDFINVELKYIMGNGIESIKAKYL
ncbi:MAG: methyltransferase domain-containing protein [Methanobrevibacter sp.]|nr:methyltransferase domain-containing protein [Methanobrevibacter sp.]